MSALKKGDKATLDDIWFRNVILTDHVSKTGDLKHSAFKGKAFNCPEGRAWKSELSGRLLSLAGNIVEEGEAYVEMIRKNTTDESLKERLSFMGCAGERVERINQFQHKNDVIYDPTDLDNAHTNIVFYEKVPDECKELTFLDALMEILKFKSKEELLACPKAIREEEDETALSSEVSPSVS